MQVESFGSRMRARRKALGKTLGDVAEDIGVAVSTVQRYENNMIARRKAPVTDAIARALGVSADWLECRTSEAAGAQSAPSPAQELVSFPVVTSVAAHFDGVSMHIADECDRIELPRSQLGGRHADEFFAIRVRGDSMYPEFQDGDTVLVLRQSALSYSGQVGILAYGYEEMTLKRIQFDETRRWLRLVPINPMLPPRTLRGQELADCHIIGVPYLLVRDYG